VRIVSTGLHVCFLARGGAGWADATLMCRVSGSPPPALFGRNRGDLRMSLASRKKNMTWIAIFLMIAAMAMYVLSDDESLPPQELEERSGSLAVLLAEA
jgi:hypothetical protein